MQLGQPRTRELALTTGEANLGNNVWGWAVFSRLETSCLYAGVTRGPTYRGQIAIYDRTSYDGAERSA